MKKRIGGGNMRTLEETLGHEINYNHLQEVLNTLRIREKEAIILRFIKKKKYKELGILIGTAKNPSISISAEGARRITEKALRRLGHHSRKDILFENE